MDPTKGLFRRRPSSASSTQSRVRAQSSNANSNSNSSSSSLGVSSTAGLVVVAQSCPTSPKRSPLQRRSVGNERIPEDEIAQQPVTSSEAAEYAAAIEDARREQRQQQLQLQRSPSRQSYKSGGRVNSISGAGRVSSAGSQREKPEAEDSHGSAAQLQRSASTVSGFGVRPRSSPAGLHAYTGKQFVQKPDELLIYSYYTSFVGSVPSSVHGSRVDLREIDKGSAIYLGCSAPRASTLSITSSRGSSGGSAPPSPCHTPPSSPRHGVRR